jgi:hypothetical protein
MRQRLGEDAPLPSSEEPVGRLNTMTWATFVGRPVALDGRIVRL